MGNLLHSIALGVAAVKGVEAPVVPSPCINPNAAQAPLCEVLCEKSSRTEQHILENEKKFSWNTSAVADDVLFQPLRRQEDLASKYTRIADDWRTKNARYTELKAKKKASREERQEREELARQVFGKGGLRDQIAMAYHVFTALDPQLRRPNPLDGQSLADWMLTKPIRVVKTAKDGEMSIEVGTSKFSLKAHPELGVLDQVRLPTAQGLVAACRRSIYVDDSSTFETRQDYTAPIANASTSPYEYREIVEQELAKRGAKTPAETFGLVKKLYESQIQAFQSDPAFSAEHFRRILERNEILIADSFAEAARNHLHRLRKDKIASEDFNGGTQNLSRPSSPTGIAEREQMGRDIQFLEKHREDFLSLIIFLRRQHRTLGFEVPDAEGLRRRAESELEIWKPTDDYQGED